jgi:hypothetical protein
MLVKPKALAGFVEEHINAALKRSLPQRAFAKLAGEYQWGAKCIRQL